MEEEATKPYISRGKFPSPLVSFFNECQISFYFPHFEVFDNPIFLSYQLKLQLVGKILVAKSVTRDNAMAQGIGVEH